jgi:hypothetical protein
MEDFHHRGNPLNQFPITFPKFFKCLRFVFKEVKDGTRRSAAAELLGEWIISEVYPVLFGVVIQCIENKLKIRRHLVKLGGRASLLERGEDGKMTTGRAQGVLPSLKSESIEAWNGK